MRAIKLMWYYLIYNVTLTCTSAAVHCILAIWQLEKSSSKRLGRRQKQQRQRLADKVVNYK